MATVAQPISPTLIPPLDPLTQEPARPTGETFKSAEGDPAIVYEMNFVDHDATNDPANREPVINPETGEQLTRKGDHGPYPVYTRPTRWKKQEFILEAAPIGEVRILRHFRPTEGEVQAQQRGDLVRRFSEQLAERAVARGITPEQLVATLLDEGAARNGDAEPEAAPEKAAGGLKVVNLGSGWWNVEGPDGQMMSEKSLRKAEAHKLAGELANVLDNAADETY